MYPSSRRVRLHSPETRVVEGLMAEVGRLALLAGGTLFLEIVAHPICGQCPDQPMSSPLLVFLTLVHNVYNRLMPNLCPAAGTAGELEVIL